MNAYKTHSSKARGFTLIEILVVIGMLAILSTAVLVAVNPLRQFAEARNSERQSDVAAILNAVSERIADNGGLFTTVGSTDGCTVNLPATTTDMDKGQLNIMPCLVPNYISNLPHDPTDGINTCTTSDCSDVHQNFDLKYTIMQDSSTNRITICAPEAAESAIPGSTSFCLSR